MGLVLKNKIKKKYFYNLNEQYYQVNKLKSLCHDNVNVCVFHLWQCKESVLSCKSNIEGLTNQNALKKGELNDHLIILYFDRTYARNSYVVFGDLVCMFSDIQPGDLRGRSGSIQAALNLEIPDKNVRSYDVKIEGLNGQLPNLDLFNLVVRLCYKERALVTLHRKVNKIRLNMCLSCLLSIIYGLSFTVLVLFLVLGCVVGYFSVSNFFLV